MVSLSSLLPPPKKDGQNSKRPESTSQLIVRETSANSQLAPVTSKLPLALRREKLDLQRPNKDAIESLKKSTEESLNLILQKHLGKAPPPPKESIVKYTAAQGKEQELRIIEAEYDPLEPPRHKFVRAPDTAESVEVPVLRAPPKSLTKEERKAWIVPPSISQWKNKKGHVLPLEFRQGRKDPALLASEDEVVNEGHAALVSALSEVEAKTRDERELRQLELEEERDRTELEKRKPLRQGLKRDAEISSSNDVQFDSRLFHQSKRRRETYDEPLFAAQQAASTIYRPKGETETTERTVGPIEFEKEAD